MSESRISQFSSSTPTGWTESCLGDLLEVVRGVGFPATAKKATSGDGIVGCLRTTNVQATVEWDDLWFIPETFVRSPDQIVRKHDILISLANSLYLVGKVALVGEVPVRSTLGAFISAIRTPEPLDARFVYYQMAAEQTQQAIRAMASTTTNISNVSTTKVANLPLRIAPLSEQTRIADRIDELFTDLAAGVASLERVKRNLARYRAAVLHAAVTGRLTAGWRKKNGKSEEPAPKLLQRILIERRRQWEQRALAKYEKAGKEPPKGWKERYTEPKPPRLTTEGTQTVLPTLPAGWCWASIDQVSDVTGGVAKNQKEAGRKGMREVPYLRVANVQRGFLNLDEIKSISATEADIHELRLQVGDVLFTEGGDRDKLGRGWVWNGELGECIHQNHIFRARLFLSELLPVLVSHAGNSYGQIWFRSNGIQSVNLASISLGVLRQFPVPIAPATEQAAIVEAVTEKLSQIDSLEAEVARGLTRAAGLRQAILRAAFEGKLVPQDPADEPAEMLLERIRAQRTAMPAQKRRFQARRAEKSELRGRNRRT
ncbi:MAG: restriction endonuclease subunit S [Phycisphaerales bacterium]|nr:restriction endonuclease subunit S [Phycisphaerales bacterium]